MQAGATGRHRPFPEKRASFARLQVQARHQARPARRELRHAHVRLRQPAAREAEAAPDLRHARAAVPPLLRRRPRAARARPARTCCSCSSRGSTTSSTAWASARRAPRRASSSAIGRSRSTARSSTSRRRWSRPATSSAVTEKAQGPAAHPGFAAARREGRLPLVGRGRREEDVRHVQGRAGPLRIRPGHQRKPGGRAVFEVTSTASARSEPTLDSDSSS